MILVLHLGQKYNKAFKTDSQRMAFFIPSLGFVFKVVWLGFVVSVAHYLTRRYGSQSECKLDRIRSCRYIRLSAQSDITTVE